jgi:hypothetical protein
MLLPNPLPMRIHTPQKRTPCGFYVNPDKEIPMVMVKGRMAVNIVNGRKGEFRVANLYSEIGDFVLYYDGLDQFEPGTYEGEFGIRLTVVRVRVFGVCKIIEPLAFVDEVKLENADESLREEIMEVFPDPVEEEIQYRDKDVPELSAKRVSDLTQQDVKELFGSLYPLREQIKLNLTVGRQVLRAQTTYLKSIGYKYVAMEQNWIKWH